MQSANDPLHALHGISTYSGTKKFRYERDGKVRDSYVLPERVVTGESNGNVTALSIMQAAASLMMGALILALSNILPRHEHIRLGMCLRHWEPRRHRRHRWHSSMYSVAHEKILSDLYLTSSASGWVLAHTQGKPESSIIRRLRRGLKSELLVSFMCIDIGSRSSVRHLTRSEV